MTAPAPACPPGESERTLSALTGCSLNSPCPCPWPSPLPLPWPWPHPLPCPRRSPAGRSTAGASGLTACTVPCKLAGCCWYRMLAKLPPGPARAPPEAALWRTWAECATSGRCGKVAATAARWRDANTAAASFKRCSAYRHEYDEQQPDPYSPRVAIIRRRRQDRRRRQWRRLLVLAQVVAEILHGAAHLLWLREA